MGGGCPMKVNPTSPGSEPFSDNVYRQSVRPQAWQNPQPSGVYDLAVIGAGPAGLAAVELATRHGLRVAIIERDRLGGNSLNAGSIPSKAMIRTGRVDAALRDGADIAVSVPAMLQTNFAAVMARMRRIRTRIAGYQSAQRLSARGVDVYFGDAQFLSPGALAVGGVPISFKKALIASGAQSQRSNITGLEQIGYFTSESIFDITALPKRLAVIGGGPLGCELAQAFCRLGSQVTIVQNDPKFLPHEERDAAELLSLALSKDGVETRLNTTVIAARQGKGEKLIDTVNNEVNSSIAVDEILLSIGRVPNTANLGLEAAGIESDAVDGINVDDYLCTTNTNVYAAGDACKAHKFTNIAETSACIAVRNAFGQRTERESHLLIPWCTYCDPEIAHIGMHVLEAKRQSIPITSFTVMMQDVDRAITDGQDEGFVKLYVRDGSDEILGATIVAARASEMINEMSVIMCAGIGMRRLATILHTYPAQSSAIRMAALAYEATQPSEPW